MEWELGDDRILRLDSLAGDAITPLIADLAQLRITVFREWPYLYAGDVDYEAWYLERFAKARDAVLVTARDGDRLVGASRATCAENGADKLLYALGIDHLSAFGLSQSKCRMI